MHWGHDDDDEGSGGAPPETVWDPVFTVTDAVPQAKAALGQLRGKWVIRRQHERRTSDWCALWWCRWCERVFRWEEMRVGMRKVSVPGTLKWRLEGWEFCCPFPDCGLGHGFDDLRDYEEVRAAHPAWPEHPEPGEHLPANAHGVQAPG
jgi:hypothetical protein